MIKALIIQLDANIVYRLILRLQDLGLCLDSKSQIL